MKAKKAEEQTPEVVVPVVSEPEQSNAGVPENSNAIPEAPKKRGRPKGSHNTPKGDAPKKTQARQAQDTVALGKQLVGLHHLAALATGLPELVIGETEGQMLAGGIQAVCDEYGLSLSGKTGAAIQLIGAAGVVYMPRLLAIRARRAAERAQAEKDAPIDVDVTMGPSNAGNFAAN